MKCLLVQNSDCYFLRLGVRKSQYIKLIIWSMFYTMLLKNIRHWIWFIQQCAIEHFHFDIGNLTVKILPLLSGTRRLDSAIG